RNQVGALAHVCEILAGEHINIDYAYCSAGGRKGRTLGIFKVSNTERAMRVLRSPSNHAKRRRLGPRPIQTRTPQAPSPKPLIGRQVRILYTFLNVRI